MINTFIDSCSPLPRPLIPSSTSQNHLFLPPFPHPSFPIITCTHSLTHQLMIPPFLTQSLAPFPQTHSYLLPYLTQSLPPFYKPLNPSLPLFLLPNSLSYHFSSFIPFFPRSLSFFFYPSLPLSTPFIYSFSLSPFIPSLPSFPPFLPSLPSLPSFPPFLRK